MKGFLKTLKSSNKALVLENILGVEDDNKVFCGKFILWEVWIMQL